MLHAAVAWLQDVPLFGFFRSHVEISFVIWGGEIALPTLEILLNGDGFPVAILASGGDEI
jgi:hypothetical protein